MALRKIPDFKVIVTDRYGKKHRFSHVKEVDLPDWGEKCCDICDTEIPSDPHGIIFITPLSNEHRITPSNMDLCSECAWEIVEFVHNMHKRVKKEFELKGK